ncbi:expressed conserved protein [Elysia marginata]|uniref:Expressed conserved protein n=1 Tax=Elysia marginata TaxID=1093978 RepID=A0AAV4JVM9_9GAST|nr:expressed conserved protein [Elysia marginata]
MDTTFQPFRTYSCRLTTASNERIVTERHFPEEFKFTYYDYRCAHHGEFKSMNKKSRVHSSFKQGCQAKIYVSVDKYIKKIILRTLNDQHNHPISEELYHSYPQRRLLNEEEELALYEQIDQDLPVKDIKKKVEQKFGKTLLCQDIRNLKYRWKRKAPRKIQPAPKRGIFSENTEASSREVHSGYTDSNNSVVRFEKTDISNSVVLFENTDASNGIVLLDNADISNGVVFFENDSSNGIVLFESSTDTSNSVAETDSAVLSNLSTEHSLEEGLGPEASKNITLNDKVMKLRKDY